MHNKKILALLFAALFLVFGAAACGDDDDDPPAGADTDDTDSEDSEDSDDGGEESGNADVQAYCDAADEYAADIDTAAESGDTDELTALSESGTELATQAAGLTGVSAEDAEVVGECSQVVADAGQRLVEAMTGG